MSLICRKCQAELELMDEGMLEMVNALHSGPLTKEHVIQLTRNLRVITRMLRNIRREAVEAMRHH